MLKSRGRKVALLLVVVVVILLGGFCAGRNHQRVARPCLAAAAPAAMQKLGNLPDAEDIADDVDVVCVLQGDGGSLTMHYYEDDDGFADFVPYAVATGHAQQLLKYHSFTGEPDDGQRLALVHLMGVRSDGAFHPVFALDGNKWFQSGHPVSNPGAVVTHVQYGGARPLSIGDALRRSAPSNYKKGAQDLTIGLGAGDFKTIREASLPQNQPFPGVSPRSGRSAPVLIPPLKTGERSDTSGTGQEGTKPKRKRR